MKKSFLVTIVLLLASLPLAYLLKVYSSLPSIIPTHFDFSGNPNGFTEKHYIIWIILSLSLFSVGLFFLIRHLPQFDPKITASQSAVNMQKIAMIAVALISTINISILYSSVTGHISFNKLFNPLMGIFFVLIGNLMYNIKPNYFVGIRVPWTLENPDNWRATHRIGGKIWVLGGILIVICSPFLSGKRGEYFFIATTCALALVPIAYSFLYFKKHQIP